MTATGLSVRSFKPILSSQDQRKRRVREDNEKRHLLRCFVVRDDYSLKNKRFVLVASRSQVCFIHLQPGENT